MHRLIYIFLDLDIKYTAFVAQNAGFP